MGKLAADFPVQIQKAAGQRSVTAALLSVPSLLQSLLAAAAISQQCLAPQAAALLRVVLRAWSRAVLGSSAHLVFPSCFSSVPKSVEGKQ